MDVLDPNQHLPKGADAIWMSQFLDCFSEPQILAILNQVAGALEENNSLYVSRSGIASNSIQVRTVSTPRHSILRVSLMA